MQELLAAAVWWFRNNGLQVNAVKTQHLLCTLSRDHPRDFEGPVRLLGFALDCKLVWEEHVDVVCLKLSRILFLLRRLKNLVTANYLVMVYHPLFHSHVA